MRWLSTTICWLALAICTLGGTRARAAAASTEPFMIETKVQVDLENLLSRVMPREQFLVQVHTEVATRQERRLVEGETVTVRPEPTQAPVATMPGFLPEPEVKPPSPPPQTREIFRLVETPVVSSVIVHTTFDESVDLDLLARCKTMVQAYMREAYPNKAVMTFSQIPMLKPVTKRDVASTDPKKEEEQLTPEERMWNQAKWIVLGLLAFFAFLIWQRGQREAMAAAAAAMGVAGGTRRRANEDSGNDLTNALRPLYDNPFTRMLPKPFRQDTEEAEEHQEEMVELRRRKLLNKFLLRSEAFRLYYDKLREEERSELYAALNGPGFESLLEGLQLDKVTGEENDPQRLEESISYHEKHFDEFAQAKDWQDRQFFGFLHALGDESVLALVNHETSLAACLMLRYMRPGQSAYVLDALTPERREAILGHLKEVQDLPLSKMLHIERGIRAASQKVPHHAFGSPKEDVEFWGNVLTESHDQDALLGELERMQPEIYPKLAKYRFKLEDAATLPENLLQRVLGEVENDELGMALATCNDDVVEVILDAVSPRRRELLSNQIDTYRGMDQAETNSARLKLTKRFREALA